MYLDCKKKIFLRLIIVSYFSAKFPALHDMMKKVMSSEMEIVVKEERYVVLFLFLGAM